MTASAATSLLTPRPTTSAFRADVLEGLIQPRKRLSCKYFYDQRGSRLFDAICQQPEYYLMRTEQDIMEQYAGDIAQELGPQAMLIELGSGSSIKTRRLLDNLNDPVAYVPVDISREHLLQTARRLRRDYPNVEVLPTCADFTNEFQLPAPRRQAGRRAVYFPGSTIGNFCASDAVELLTRIGGITGPESGLVIGVDLVKEETTLNAAYNDAAGVTAQFNLNLLVRINQELGGDFNLDQFEHRAVYDPCHLRMDIGLRSLCGQRVTIGESEFDFSAGEIIHTEYSHKYTVAGFGELARRAGWHLQRHWVDTGGYFGVLTMQRRSAPELSLHSGRNGICK